MAFQMKVMGNTVWCPTECSKHLVNPFSPTFFTVRLHVMQRMVLLSQYCLSVRPSDACIVTKLNNALRIF